MLEAVSLICGVCWMTYNYIMLMAMVDSEKYDNTGYDAHKFRCAVAENNFLDKQENRK